MEKVTAYQQLNKEIGARFKSGLRTNCNLTGDELNHLIGTDALYSRLSGPNMFLFEKIFGETAEFFRMYYYLLDGIEPNFDFPGCCICENVFQDGTDSLPAPWFKTKGFIKMFERRRMTLLPKAVSDIDDSFVKCTSAPESSNIPSAQEILALFRECFDPRTAYLPDFAELKEELVSNQIFWAYEGSALVGAAEVVKRKGYNELRHIAVHPDFRGRAYASAILKKVMLNYASQKLVVWVRKDNIPALKLYYKAGFVEDKYASAVWLKQ